MRPGERVASATALSLRPLTVAEKGAQLLGMVVQPSLVPVQASRRAKWASDLIERLERGIDQRGIDPSSMPSKLDAIVRGSIKTTWHRSKLVQSLALGVGILLLVALTMPLPRSRHTGWRRLWAGRALYALTVVNPFLSVLANDYTFVRDAQRSYVLAVKGVPPQDNTEKLRQLVTGVGAVKPRRLLVLGAVLRGVQLHSPLRRIFDPPASFGVGINLLALIDGVAWPASLLLGWALSAPWWRLGEAGGAAGGSLGSTGSAAANGTATRVAHPNHGPEPHPNPRHGLVLELHLPTEHLAAIAVGFLVLTEKMRALRWTLILILAQTRATFARSGGA